MSLYDELLTVGIDFINNFENDTHLMRMCARYITKKGYKLITLEEYNFLMDLATKINVYINFKKTR